MQITDEMIRNKAYELWEADGKPEGSAEKNWFAAKALLQQSDDQATSNRNQSPPIGLRQLTTP
jgi:hypothetical protein